MRITSALTLTTLAILLSVNTAFSTPWDSTIGSGYAITSSLQGISAPLGTSVTLTAGTLDARVSQVTFKWFRPDSSLAREVIVPVFTNGSSGMWENGTIALIRYATDACTPDAVGDWGAQAFFLVAAEPVVAIRATTFTITQNQQPPLPEFPLGSAMPIVAIPLILFLWRKKKKASSGK